jgi:tRNA C32,U32 (ribose-2'-O)-methylase TrmJ
LTDKSKRRKIDEVIAREEGIAMASTEDTGLSQEEIAALQGTISTPSNPAHHLVPVGAF